MNEVDLWDRKVLDWYEPKWKPETFQIFVYVSIFHQVTFKPIVAIYLKFVQKYAIRGIFSHL